MTSQVSKYSSCYLGTSTLVVPVFRDLSPEGVRTDDGLVAWSDSAVFAITFDTEAVGAWPGQPFTEFFDHEGWPVGLPTERRNLGADVKREFQVFFRQWRTWDDASWRIASSGRLKTLRLLTSATQALLAP